MVTEFRNVVIEWFDDPDDCYAVTVGVDGAWNGFEEDDDVFFWFASEEEFQSCVKGDSERFEFKILEVD